MRNKRTQELVLLAFLTALTTALGLIVKIPTLNGVTTLLDVGIYFSAFYLGGRQGAIVGGCAGFLFDLLAGYPQWMFISLFAHGGQGFFAGWTGKKQIIGIALASVSMIGGYFMASSFMYNVAEAATGVLGNTLQNFVGLVLGYILSQAAEKIGVFNHVAKGN